MEHVLWMVVLELPDGSQVESSVLALERDEAGEFTLLYRVHLADGSVTEFATLTSVLRYLLDQYGVDELNPAGPRSERRVHAGRGRAS